MRKIHGVYKITSLLYPDRFYIGSSCDVKGRWSKHKTQLRKGNHVSRYMQRHFNKHGEADMSFSIIEEVTPANTLFLLEREQYYLDLLHPVFNTCKTASVTTGVKMSEAHRRQISKRLKGVPFTRDHRERLGREVYGYSLKTGSPLYYRLIRDADEDGFDHSRISACCYQKAFSHKGYVWSHTPLSLKEANALIAKATKSKHVIKRVVQMTMDGKVVQIWSSMAEAAREGGFISHCICACCLNTKKSHKGYAWRYY